MPFRYPFLPLSAFPSSAPRYPNVWFHVASDLTERLDVGLDLHGGRPRVQAFDKACWLVYRGLEKVLGVRNDYGYFHIAEGSDASARAANLDRYVDPDHPERSHAHQVHVRYYTHAFKRLDDGSVVLEDDDGTRRAYYRFAGSVHYEIETGDPLHASVDWCPACGRKGEYAIKGDMSEVVHDPMGLEYLMNGTVQGRTLYDGMGLSYPGVVGLARDYDLRIVEYDEPPAPDINTARVALVFIDGLRRETDA